MNQRHVRRCVILIELDDGMQIGYQVDGPTTTATITALDDPPDLYDIWNQTLPPRGPRRGRIEAEGYLTGMMKMPDDVFEDRPEIGPQRMEIER